MAPLDRAKVKTRQQAGRDLSYIEAYHAENEANRIFGFDAWDRTTELTHIGEREQDGKWRVYYRAKVQILVRSPDGGQVIREGNGFGSGIDKDLGQAHESALKEAESDAEKRALKTFGNPFGQALYDKSQSEVAEKPKGPSATATFVADQLRLAKTKDEFTHLWNTNKTGLREQLDVEEFAWVLEVMREEAKRFAAPTAPLAEAA
ncbi:MAG: hypothetical protein EON87_13670 [Brevundimonas sp.]|nr:MAG: hypothetical protein EON87_13670 [Brevundimonas sp.]